MNNTKKLNKLLEELLTEAEPIERPASMADFASEEPKPVSLDQAIDRYFIQYERESIPTSEIFEQKKTNDVGKFVTYLLEQDLDVPEPEEDPELEPPPGGDADLDLGADLGDVGGEELPADDAVPGDETATQKPVINTPQINLQDFTRSVARLVNNAQSLIDFKTLILNRAEKYIQSNYNTRTASEMMDLLDTQWDLRPESSEITSTNPSKYPQPHTAVTGPVGG